MQQEKNLSSLKNYIIVTVAYWAFTLSDGALRMLVLLHFHGIGYNAFQVAMLFLLYEFFGMVSNLVGGWVAARLGIRSTLLTGLALQVIALMMLSMLDPGWVISVSITYVMIAQALSGIAKDLTKMSAKSGVRLVSGEAGGQLYHWVAVLTGSKNALKGAGFFVGGMLLTFAGFVGSLWILSAMLMAALLYAMALPTAVGRVKTKPRFSSLFSKSPLINSLSWARLFLFGSRDAWFAVGLPLYLVNGQGWTAAQVGSFMAAWVIGYGIVQASTSWLFRDRTPGAGTSLAWISALTLLTLVIVIMLNTGLDALTVILAGLTAFAALFAVNSAIHSFLVLAYSDSDNVTLNVGFYYMANAAGRLIGTLLSGAAYYWQGINGCLATATMMLVVSAVLSLRLRVIESRQPDQFDQVSRRN
ncbi:MAG: organoarsenical effux MFS transporter ArsJ [Gammaproteobacteria bacterium]|nr:organoarsenical effux MFS transporter ArsJ [Gammaproteobacteria bacterium]